MTTSVLFLHQNYPGQFKLLSMALARRPEFRIAAIGEGHRTLVGTARIDFRGYGRRPSGEEAFPPLAHFGEHMRRGRAARQVLIDLKRAGFHPDVTIAHPGWGEALFLKDVFPRTRLISFLEFYYRATDSDLDFDPEFHFPRSDGDIVSLRNIPNLQAAAVSDVVLSPTRWQAGLFPEPLRSQIEILHEGIDTEAAKPGPAQRIILPDGPALEPGQPLVTYVARSLEPYRGFHSFMRALPALQRRHPSVRVAIVGKEDVSYGRGPRTGSSWKEELLAEVGQDLDLSRIHFLGTIPYEELINLFRLSTVHVYLTYPFILSWSLLEAMACGCVVVGSDTGPLQEIIRSGENGRLVDFFDTDAIAETIVETLNDEAWRERLSAAARQTALAYDFRRVALPRYEALIRDR
jgi:glycosyltransferase involved in cell wall biosynthesis